MYAELPRRPGAPSMTKPGPGVSSAGRSALRWAQSLGLMRDRTFLEVRTKPSPVLRCRLGSRLTWAGIRRHRGRGLQPRPELRAAIHKATFRAKPGNDTESERLPGLGWSEPIGFSPRTPTWRPS
jgi:hypothetical protein